jgi:hypothetical protein
MPSVSDRIHSDQPGLFRGKDGWLDTKLGKDPTGQDDASPVRAGWRVLLDGDRSTGGLREGEPIASLGVEPGERARMTEEVALAYRLNAQVFAELAREVRTDPFSPAVVAQVTRHMNEDHAEDSLLIVRALGGHPDARAVRMAGEQAAVRVPCIIIVILTRCTYRSLKRPKTRRSVAWEMWAGQGKSSSHLVLSKQPPGERAELS